MIIQIAYIALFALLGATLAVMIALLTMFAPIGK